MSTTGPSAAVARAMAKVASNAPARPDHALRVARRNLLVSYRGRTHSASSTVTYHRSHVRNGPHTSEAEFRLIDAEHVHGDEQVFWQQRQNFYRSNRTAPLMPIWDRLAHVAILTTRKVERVPQEAAFRLMAVYLKLMFLPSIVGTVSAMLPLWKSHNVQGLLGKQLKDKNGDGEKDEVLISTTSSNQPEEAAANVAAPAASEGAPPAV